MSLSTNRRRYIVHVDIDAFFAAVEVLLDPSLAGKPVIVGGLPHERGVASTCSYEARKFGVRSAMPSVTAMRLCPQGVWLHPRIGLYAEVSHRIRKIFDEFTPLVEPLSIDEAFLDMTGLAKDLAQGAAIARKLKDRIRAEERLTASVGVASFPDDGVTVEELVAKAATTLYAARAMGSGRVAYYSRPPRD